jgi:hypothetical protein
VANYVSARADSPNATPELDPTLSSPLPGFRGLRGVIEYTYVASDVLCTYSRSFPTTYDPDQQHL